MADAIFQAKFIINGLFLQEIGFYLHENKQQPLKYWISDDLLLKQERIFYEDIGKYKDQMAIFVLINISEQEAQREKQELSEYRKAQESNDDIKLKDYRLKFETRERNRIDYAKNRLRTYLQMCALISKPTPSMSLDIGGTRVLNSINQIGQTWHFSDLPFSYIYEISPKEKTNVTEEFKDFLVQTKRIVTKYNILSQRFSFLSLATEYAYTSKLNFQTYDPTNKDSDTDYLLRGFIDAIISLEALFNEAPNDISYKIAIRASFILSLAGISRIETFTDIKKAYSNRNDIVHGKKKVELDKEFVDKIQMYARRSVQCMYALCLTFDGNKQDLIKMIDETMLVTSKIQDMQQQIENRLHDFDRTCD